MTLFFSFLIINFLFNYFFLEAEVTAILSANSRLEDIGDEFGSAQQKLMKQIRVK